MRREFPRLIADEDRAELKRAKRTNTEGYINCGGFLEAVSHVGSWPMGEFVDATRMHIYSRRTTTVGQADDPES